MLYCMDCGNKEYVDEELENVCPVCTAKYDTTSLASFTPNPERLKKGFGTNVKIITEHSTMGVQKTLQKLLTSKSPFLMEDNADHVCAAKLMVGIRYFLQRRKEAKNELRIA